MPRTLKVIDIADTLGYHEPGSPVFVWDGFKILGPVKSVFRLTPGLAEDLGIEVPPIDPYGHCPVMISMEAVPHAELPWRGRTSLTS